MIIFTGRFKIQIDCISREQFNLLQERYIGDFSFQLAGHFLLSTKSFKTLDQAIECHDQITQILEI